MPALSTSHEQPCPQEAPPGEWGGWSRESRYLFIERLGMGADSTVALEQARRNHKAEGGRLF